MTVEERLTALESDNAALRSELEKNRIEAETRLAALQYLTAQLFRQVYVLGNLDDATVSENHRKAVQLFKNYTHGGSDAAMSDHISAEIEHWIEDTLNDAEEFRKFYKSRGLPG